MKTDWERVEAHLEAQRYSLALEILDETFPEYGVSPQADYYRGLCYVRLGRDEEALDPLERVVTGEAPVTLVYQCRMVLALIYNRTGRYRLAEFEVRTILDQGLESPQAYASLGYALFMTRRREEGLEMYRKAHSLDKRNSNALNSLGYVMADLDIDPGEALRYCKQALNIVPDNPAYLDSAGWACYKLGRYEDAKNYLRRAMKLSGGNPEVAAHMRILLDN